MAQETRTVNDLIQRAFQLIGEFSPYETVDGVDFETAYDILNLIIDSYSGESNYIPITQEVIFNLIPQQRDYIFSNVVGITPDVVSNRIVEIMYCEIVRDNFSWPVREITRTQLLDNAFSLSVDAIPAYVLLQKGVEKSTLSFYSLPNQAYECRLQAKFYLDKFQKFQPIRNVPLSIQEFLIYACARKLKAYYPSSNWTAETEDDYQKMLDNLFNTNDIDMSVRPSSLLRYRGYLYNGTIGIIGGL